MAIPPPTAPYPAQQHGTYTGSAGQHAPTSTSTTAYGGGGAQNLQHPPGYVQNAGASAQLDRYQQRSNDSSGYGYGYGGEEGSGQGQGHGQHQNQSSFFGGGGGSGGGSGEGGSAVWDTAKKWAQATGQKLADAESEVWRRINKE